MHQWQMLMWDLAVSACFSLIYVCMLHTQKGWVSLEKSHSSQPESKQLQGRKKKLNNFFFCDWHPKVLKNEQGYFFWKAGVRFLLMFKWHFGETLKVSGWSSISWMRFTALLGLGCIQKPLSQWEGFQSIWQDFRSDCAAQMLQTKHL